MELLQSLFQVTLGGLILGAGLPILFALGVRFAVPHKDSSDGSSPNKVVAWIFFGIIIVALIVGILWIAQGRISSTFGIDLFGTGGKGV
ncbi:MULTISPECIES: hypothetical protein [unclassified Corynebacterium]|uniref:hypothetical protein n=1 Tax=unclassified Corynebacterium TaxID=2624378 RepID=UPI0021AA7671|nr:MULTISPECIES: hypothetical protein [unclassified Corynebacterium]MCT1451354.1 hypothetical protein [Corynebacterium sp. p3-SID1145]MCT1460638.1 hypothetical protein [Corynebacterium sp. p3-SID1140]MDN8593746.1 hypothetical protein [Corynebacterium sp. P4_F2]WKK55860.1 hypothetical protein QYR03_01075 [Corynebacterium sp. P4-C1]WKK63268.1 hypothetical protein QYR04_10775 [Corynebacterium sp. P8-C1]